MVAKFGMWRRKKPTHPKNLRTPVTSVGGGSSLIDRTLSGSGDIPFVEILNPRNLKSLTAKLHLSKFNFRPALFINESVSFR